MAIILFPDRLSDLRRHLRRAHEGRASSILVESFLRKAYGVLRDEAGILPRHARAQIPVFNSVFDLSERHHSSRYQRIEISAALTCACQLVHVIGYYGERADQFPMVGHDHPIVGLGIGQLSASAVVCAGSLTELVDIAVKAVRLAFRVGSVVGRISQFEGRLDEASESWSMIVPGAASDIERELKNIQDQLSIAASERTYISNSSRSACVISGRPARLRQLEKESGFFSKSQIQHVPSVGLWHSAQVYGESDVSQVVDPIQNDLAALPPPCRDILSPSTCRIIEAKTAKDLFMQTIDDMLRQRIRWDGLQQVILNFSERKDLGDRDLLSFQSSHAAKSLLSILQLDKDQITGGRDITDWCSSSGSKCIERQENANIAIVGMSCRLPGADSNEQFWDLLEQGRDTHRRVPTDRFNIDTHYDPSGKKTNTSQTPYGCFIEKPGLFDPRFFNMSPREANETDPMHRLAIVTAYEALENSGFVLNATPSTQQDRVGTFYGQTCDDWREVNAAQNIETYFIPGGVRAFAPGRISFYFGFRGPSYSVDTACSSSLAAVQIACQSLRTGDCDTAVTGGVNILTAPDIFAGLSKGQFLSKTGGCKTWDVTADGYCRADGVGSVILKREDDALADKDNILGVILASGTNHSADAISITHPHAGNQAYLYESVLHSAGVDPTEISYVEMHGTGTQAGDTNEMESVTGVFAPAGSRLIDNALHIGAVKANIGHGEAAAGMAALIKVLLMMQKSVIPPHIGIKTGYNPNLPNLASINVRIPFQNTIWPRDGMKPRYAFVNNFSAAGGNTALLVRDGPPQKLLSVEDPRKVLPFVVSAKSTSSLEKNIQQLISYTRDASAESFSSLSYTLTARRLHHSYRVGVAASDLAGLRSALEAKLEEGNFTPISSRVPPVAFVFTSQGIFYPSLGRDLFESSSAFRSEILHLNDLATRQGLPAFLPAVNGRLDEAHEFGTQVVQLALVCVQIALVELWHSWGIHPSIVIGHSLGEYGALYAAGVLSKDDTIHLVGRRAGLLQERCAAGSHSMLAVKASVSNIESVLGGQPHEIVCMNTARETVLGGSADQMENCGVTLRQAGYKCLSMDLPYAFHSAQVDPILSDFQELAKGAIFNRPRIPVISPLLSEVVDEEQVFNPIYLSRHARQPVNFMDSINTAIDQDRISTKTAFVEIGPHPVCTGMIKSIIDGPALTVASLRKSEAPWQTLSQSLSSLYIAGLSVDWRAFHRDHDASHKLLDLPGYSFDNKNYWIGYVNDWCLHKTEPRNPTVADTSDTTPDVSRLSTASVHRIVSERFDGEVFEVVAQSDMSQSAIKAAVLGHMVNGAGLCPSSIYADIALTLGNHIFKRLNADLKHSGLNVGDMEVVKPLIIKDENTFPHILQVTVTGDLERQTAKLRFVSLNIDGHESTLQATCKLLFEDPSTWSEQWSSSAYLINGRIETLRDHLKVGKADQISRGLAYKLFSALVQYDAKYQGMEEVILDSADFEATSKVKFQTEDKDGSFFFSPFWIDSLCHLSGFILNGSGAVDSKNFVYISHGWKSMRFGRSLNRDTQYRAYVRMQSQPSNIMAGDVYVLDGDMIIGVVGGLKFQRIPRAILNNVVRPAAPTTLNPPAPEKFTTSTISASRSAKKMLNATGREKSRSSTSLKSRPRNKKNDISSSSLTSLAHMKQHKHTEERNVVNRAMDIISQETELPLKELQGECLFADLGVDSLLSLQISGRFREDLEIDIQSSIFTTCATVGELQNYLERFEGSSQRVLTSASSSSDLTEDNDSDDFKVASSISSQPSTPSTSSLSRKSSDLHRSDTIMLFRKTIADQMGIELEEVKGTNDLLSLGMDSLMAIVILGILREKTGLDLPPDLFIQHPSMDAIQIFLGLSKTSPPKSEKSARRPQKTAVVTSTTRTAPHAVSLLMQGNPKSASKTLFLIPDGSGSATSYASIPRIDPSVAVYGLNCPFMTNPSDFTIGIDGVASLYLTEIRRRQAQGPYYLGGWSAGGVIAYEITLQLLDAGERVENLILLDAPCPIRLEPLPSRLHHFFADIGILGGGEGQEPPSWLLPHFEASIKALTAYEPAPIENQESAPKTLAIWARHGVCRYPGDPRPEPRGDDPKSMKWLLENRSDFGTNGWEKLLGAEAMEMETCDGNHFSLMKDRKQLRRLASLIREFLVEDDDD